MDDRLIAIARRLTELTTEGKLRWQGSGAEYSTALTTGKVVVSSDRPEGRYPYVMRVSDRTGAEIGVVETGHDAEQFLGDGEADPWELAVHDLYAAARASADGTSAGLDAIVAELERR